MSEILILVFGTERVLRLAVFGAVSAGERVSDEFNDSFLDRLRLKKLAVSKDALYRNPALAGFCPFLEDDSMLLWNTFAVTGLECRGIAKYKGGVSFCRKHLVGKRAGRIVQPQVEPVLAAVIELDCKIIAFEGYPYPGACPVERHSIVFDQRARYICDAVVAGREFFQFRGSRLGQNGGSEQQYDRQVPFHVANIKKVRNCVVRSEATGGV